MGHYKVNSTDSRNFSLSKSDVLIGELKYSKWYSFKAEVSLADGSIYTLEPKGFWDSKIELRKGDKTILYFEMGWKGIVINFIESEKKYLLRLKGLLSSKYVLVDIHDKELLAVETNFKWSKLTFDFNIETSGEFDEFDNNEVLLLTTLHCINYYMAFVNSTV
ncbi:hypothetical protein HUK80_01800 [Flavobacterium sp. MAH-1]|uniref:Uncharacterized protein n=1 Tax=Flavobacterium agri TaxID=2743471 RepID=A0A7Y8XZB7_9FLAO|nr:hypothetical protein [Flavobacterium agri]NUY79613.1 hypothetical protein [Flavobacterium agri]NYA69638.1 hypothetical protein [Flavobacterium agri]